MNQRITLLTAALAVAGALSFAPADAQMSPTTSGSLAPAGQGPGQAASTPYTSGNSTESRASVKAKTRRAEAAGTLAPAGQAPLPLSKAGTHTGSGSVMPPIMSEQSRASVKAQTRAAQESGDLRPAGEAAKPLSEMPKR